MRENNGKRNSRRSDNRLVTIVITELIIIAVLLIILGTGLHKRNMQKNGIMAAENTSTQTASTDVTGGNSADGTVSSKGNEDAAPAATSEPTPTPEPTMTPEELEAYEKEQRRAETEAKLSDILEETKLMAMQYNYGAAIEKLKAIEDYEDYELITETIAEYEQLQSELVLWPDNTQISHLFVHSLIVDCKKAFGKGSSQPVGYNMYMTTVLEFNRMLEQMYERGYVMVSVHDIAKRVVDENGEEKLVKNDIWLPEGKTPFVLSQDDVNYYKYMFNNGFADRIVIGDDGLPTCAYIQDDGTEVYGEYDMLPIVDRFLREHPDFSYRGSKGILAVTGYEGALGYDTGWHMWNLDDPNEAAKLKAAQEEASKVAEAIRADGWEFASHSYTHTNMTNNSVDRVIYDTNKWENEVRPILGDTDIYIYPFGADICDWRKYEGPKYDTLKAAGFWYFCNVDSSRYWIQIRDKYMRMGRINADGWMMYDHPNKLSYFFDAETVLDPDRPAKNW